jgi:hypothetical protein
VNIGEESLYPQIQALHGHTGTTRPRSCQRFTNHDYACVHCTRMPSDQPLTGHVIRQGRGPALRRKLRLARHRAHPRDKLCLARTQPRLPAPRESRGRPILQLWRTSSNLRMGSVATSGGPPPRPRPVLPSISVMEDVPNVELTHPLKSFSHAKHYVNNYVMGNPTQGARVRDRALDLGSQQKTSRHKSTTKYKYHTFYRIQ